MNEEILIPIAMFAMIFGVVYISVTSKHRQRMALIEKGMDPNLIRNSFWLRLGFIAVGAGVGLFLGRLVAHVMPPQADPYDATPDNPLPYFMMVLLCGGAALIAHHFTIGKKEQV